MEIQLQPPTTQEQYRTLVEQYSFLVDSELQRLETTQDWQLVAERLPYLISAVNVIGYLRGQHNMFLDVRPRTDFHKELYRNEDAFEARLEQLIQRLVQSEAAGTYQEKMQQYYLNYRHAN